MDALRCIDRNSTFLETLKYEAEMLAIFVLVCSGKEVIINVHEDETGRTRHSIHESLEWLSCI